MKRGDIPAPCERVIVTHFLVVRDHDTSREWYRDVLGVEVVNERDPIMLKFHNSWLILNVGGGPTDDKPEVTLEPPSDPSRTSAFLNLRVADIQQVYEERPASWTKGSSSRTTSTGPWAWRTTEPEMLPMSARRTPPNPRLPTTIKPASNSSPSVTIS